MTDREISAEAVEAAAKWDFEDFEKKWGGRTRWEEADEKERSDYRESARSMLEAAHKVEGEGGALNAALQTPEERVAQLEAAIPEWRQRVEELTQRVIEREGALRELERWCAEQANAEADISKQAPAKDRRAINARISGFRSVQARIRSLLGEEAK